MVNLKITVSIPYTSKGNSIYLQAGELENASVKLQTLLKSIQSKTTNPIYFIDSRSNPDLTSEHAASLTMPTCWLISVNFSTATEADIAFELIQTELSIDGEKNFTVGDGRLKIVFAGVRSLIRDLAIDERMKTLDFKEENEQSIRGAMEGFYRNLEEIKHKKIGNLLMAEIALKYYANCIENKNMVVNMSEYTQVKSIMAKYFPDALKRASEIEKSLRIQTFTTQSKRENAIKTTWNIVFAFLKKV